MKPKFFILGLVTLVVLALLIKHIFTPTEHVFKPITHKFELYVQPERFTLFSPEDLMKMIDSGENYIAERFHDLGIVRDDRHHYTIKGDSYHFPQKIITSLNGDTLRYVLSNRDIFNSFWQGLDKEKLLPAEKQIGSYRVIECREVDGFVFKRYGFDADYDDFCIIVIRKHVSAESAVSMEDVSQSFSYSTIKKLLSLRVERRKDLLVKIGFLNSKAERDVYGSRNHYSRLISSGGNNKFNETVIVWSNGDLEFTFSSYQKYSDLKKSFKGRVIDEIKIGDENSIITTQFEGKCLFFSESNGEFIISLIDEDHRYFKQIYK